jgi:hypothetical protein
MRTRIGGVATLVLAGCALTGALGFSGCGAAPAGDATGGVVSALNGPVTKGIIQDDHGTPLAGAKIEAHPANGGKSVVTATSAADGTFDLAASTGTYNILVTPRTRFAPQKFLGHTFTAGSHLDLILVDHREKVLAINITDQHGQAFPFAGVVCPSPNPNGCDDSTGQLTAPIGTTLSVFGGSVSLGILSGSLTVDPSTGPVVNIVVPQFNVTGTLVDQGGNPVRDAFIEAQSCPTMDFGGLTGSFCPAPVGVDDAGRFSLLMGPGTTPLFVTLRTAPGPSGFVVQQTVTGDGDVTLQVPPLERLSGRLVDRDGNALPGQLVCPRPPGCGSNKSCIFAIRCAPTDDDGRYQADVLAGTYDVVLRLQSDAFGSFNNISSTSPVPVLGPTELDFVLPNVRLTGTVLDPAGVPAPNVSVSANCTSLSANGLVVNSCPSGSGITDAEGRFQFSWAAGGDIVVTAVGPNASASLAVTLSSNADVVLQLQAPVTQAGQVLAADGSGLAGALVCYLGPPRGACATVDADGRYQLSLPPDSYQVSVNAPGPGSETFSVGQPVIVPSGPAPVVVPSPLRVTGQLFQSDGTPLSGVQVSAGCSSSQVPGGSVSLCDSGGGTDDAGRFAISTAGGSSATLQIALTDKTPVVTLPVSGVPISGLDTDLLVGIESGLLGTGPQPPPKN